MIHVCKVSGCPQKSPCEKHPPAPYRPGGSTNAERGYGAEYKRNRRRIMQGRPLCVCGTPATECDHIKIGRASCRERG